MAVSGPRAGGLPRVMSSCVSPLHWAGVRTRCQQQCGGNAGSHVADPAGQVSTCHLSVALLTVQRPHFPSVLTRSPVAESLAGA